MHPTRAESDPLDAADVARDSGVEDRPWTSLLIVVQKDRLRNRDGYRGRVVFLPGFLPNGSPNDARSGLELMTVTGTIRPDQTPRQDVQV